MMPTPERSRFEGVVPEEQAVELASLLQDLINSRGWAAYVELLKLERLNAREQAFDDSDANFSAHKGYVEGLKIAEQIPQLVIATARREARREDNAGVVRKTPRVVESNDVSF